MTLREIEKIVFNKYEDGCALVKYEPNNDFTLVEMVKTTEDSKENWVGLFFENCAYWIYCEKDDYTTWKALYKAGASFECPDNMLDRISNVDDITILEWVQDGGFIAYDEGLYIADETEYYEWINTESLEDTDENQKHFCELALKQAGYPEHIIENIMRDWR